MAVSAHTVDALNRAIVAGACWEAARLEPHDRVVWEDCALGHHRRASASIERLVAEVNPPLCGDATA